MAFYIDFVTAPYAVSNNQVAMFFVYNGLRQLSKNQAAQAPILETPNPGVSSSSVWRKIVWSE